MQTIFYKIWGKLFPSLS